MSRATARAGAAGARVTHAAAALLALVPASAGARPPSASPPSRAAAAAGAVRAPGAGPAPGSAASSVLDPALRYPKAGRLALQAYGGSYLGAAVGNSFLTGGRLTYFLSRSLGLGAGYGYSRLAGGHDLGSVSTRSIHVLSAQLELSIDSAMRFGEATVVEADLFGTVGGGALRLADDWEPSGLIGGGLRVFPGLRWLAIRVEVSNFLHRTRTADGSRFQTDVAFTLGASFLLPPRAGRGAGEASVE